MTADFISVIVPCRNESRHLRAFLDSVLRQETDGLEWEILIADGMSDDGSREILASYGQRETSITVIDNPAQMVSTGLNAAIQCARGNIIIRMDCHTEYAPDYIRQSVAALHSTGAANVGGAARTRPRGYMGRAIAAAYHSPFSTGGASFHDERYEGWVDTVPYGCWLKTTLENAGMFDEALVRNQDDELNLRLIRGGGKIWQSPAIVSWYSPRNSLAALYRQYFQYGFWKIPVIRKHRIPASWRHLVPGCFVLGNLALLGIALSLLAAGKHAAALPVLGLWAAGTGCYLLACAAAALLAAKRHGWQLLPVLPLVFAVYHVSYGLGFLLGALYWSAAGSKPRGLGRLFTAISR